MRPNGRFAAIRSLPVAVPPASCRLPTVEARPERTSPLEALKERLPGDSLFDELSEQLDRTRMLLSSNPEAAADAAMARFAGEGEVEARISAQLAAPGVLADPERFLEAHRLAVRSLEVLDREGSRNPTVSGKFGPLKPIAEFGAEYVSDYIVKGFANDAANAMRRLYARREPQASRGTAERTILAQARVEMDRIAPGFGGGGLGTPALIAGGAIVPLLASATQYFGGINFLSRPVLIALFLVLVVLFGLLSSILLSAASVAHRRCRLIAGQPLAALWEVVGNAGGPPQDNSQPFALLAIVLSALVWIVIPVGGVLVYVLT